MTPLDAGPLGGHRVAGRLILACCLAFGACGDAASPAAGVRGSRPGVTLLDMLDQGRWEQRSPGNLSPELQAELERWEQLDFDEPVRVAPERWMDGGPVDEQKSREFAELLDPGGGLRRWRLRPGTDFDLFGADARLVHAGRALERVHWHGADFDEADPVWWDEEGHTVFWWAPSSAGLLAFSARSPGPIEFIYTADPALLITRYESPAEPELPPSRLVQRFALGRETRPGLLMPAPSSFALPIAALPGDSLHLALGVLDHGFVRTAGRLSRAQGLSDGVTFKVEVHVDGAREHVWSRHVEVSNAYIEERIDLAAWEGRPVTLRFATEGGPANETQFDYAVWSDLRITGAQARAPGRPHVILIDVDTLRADRLGCYGSERATSPRIDAWARERAIVYLRSSATSSWTLPATASMLTGFDPHQHGALSTAQGVSPSAPNLAEYLRRIDYETLAFTEGGYVVPTFGFDRGFDVFADVERERLSPALPDWSRVLARLEQRHSERPVFLFLQTYMVHAPYHDSGRFPEANPEATAWLSAAPVDYTNVIDPFMQKQLELDDEARAAIDRIYDEGVARADDAVGAFLDALDEALGDEERLVILTSDHGEEVFERKRLGHGFSLHRELIEVPLVIEYPRAVGQAPGESERPASSVDIVPTVLDALGLPVPAALVGRSLLDDGGDHVERVRFARQSGEVYAIEWRNSKLIYSGDPLSGEESRGVKLFDVRSDPHERWNIADKQPAKTAALVEMLREYLRSRPPLPRGMADVTELAPEVADNLRALGYLGEDDG